MRYAVWRVKIEAFKFVFFLFSIRVIQFHIRIHIYISIIHNDSAYLFAGLFRYHAMSDFIYQTLLNYAAFPKRNAHNT